MENLCKLKHATLISKAYSLHLIVNVAVSHNSMHIYWTLNFNHSGNESTATDTNLSFIYETDTWTPIVVEM